jgi:hypothetical protein
MRIRLDGLLEFIDGAAEIEAVYGSLALNEMGLLFVVYLALPLLFAAVQSRTQQNCEQKAEQQDRKLHDSETKLPVGE